MFRILSLVLLCCSLQGCALGPAPADPTALNTPVYEPIVNGKLVRIEVIHVNGQTAPGESLEEAIKGFSKYVAGEVRTLDGGDVELELGEDGALTKEQFESVVEAAKYHSASDIAFVLAPDFEFFHSRGQYRSERRTDGQIRQSIKLNGRVIDRSASEIPFVSRETFWQIVMLHELCHALGVPADRSHTWSYGHCTNPECILYRRVDTRSVLTAILRLGPPLDLCKKCREEIRKAQEAANGNFYDCSQPYDPSDEIIRLNPGNPQAYWYLAFEHIRRKDYQKAIAACNRVIKDSPDCLEAYSLRAFANYSLKAYAKAIADFKQVIRIDPDHVSSLQMLAWLLSTRPEEKLRDGKYAVQLASRACELTDWKNASMLHCLACASAEVGNFQAAVEYETKVLSLKGEIDVESSRKMLEMFQAGKPYRESK